MQRRGFTLIEMLVSLAISLIMMAAAATLFGVVSSSVSKSRAIIETSDRLRAAREVIQRDLDGMTATLAPPLSPENGQGYFEIIEGPAQDRQPLVETGAKQELFGDIDDVLMFTVRGRDPFLGKYTPPGGGPQRIIESPVAEVVYFLVQNGPQIDTRIVDPANNLVGRLCTLYRRVLLVSPSIGSTTTIPADFYSKNDLSVNYSSPSGTPTLTANTLGDLTKRENRFAHYGDFPFLVDRTSVAKYPFSVVSAPAVPAGFTRPSAASAFLQPFDGTRLGDDVLLTNVIAFDVRVWDSQAQIRVSGDQAVTPSDQGWHLAGAVDVGVGAYVDLGHDPASLSDLGRLNPHQKPRAGFPLFPNTPSSDRIYDTWSLHYENDGIDQDQDGITDGGSDGLDNIPQNGLVDEHGERDTNPPYDIPLRGLQITLRVYEPSSQQIREVVVISAK
jgi:prepilin-type N-terminal cleavage/methylation domain-containing protein